MKIKQALSVALLTLALGSASCLGPDNAYGSIKKWNADVSDKDWLNELIFAGLFIIPVYPFALMGDVLVFNTIGYWSGEYPISDPGTFKGFTSKD